MLKRWFSRDSVKAKVGLAALVLIASAGVMASAQQPDQHDTKLQQRAALQQSTPSKIVAISEKPKIALTKTEIVTTEVEVPFTTMQTYDGILAKDTSVVRVEGRAGKKIVTIEVKTRDGVEVERAMISEEVTVQPVTKVVAIGTKTTAKPTSELPNNCDPNYKPCIKKSTSDFDCSDIGFRVQLVKIGEDPYGLDRDSDGIGCENFPEPQSP